MEEEFYTTLAEKIKEARLVANLTQAQVALALRCNRVTITRIETCVDRPSVWTLKQLETLLGVPLY